ncbi:MAG: L-lactate dehydrogenase (quinone) large subunit LdhH [Desulfovermiculus sp.]
MQTADTLKEYRHELQDALQQDFQRQALDNFARAYPGGRAKAFGQTDVTSLVEDIARRKDWAVQHMDELFEQFKTQAEAAGVHVHLAATDREANEIITRIAKKSGCKNIVKSKSMTAEETLLNHALEESGLTVTETDLGEWIIQLRDEGPSHMVMPAIHLSREEVSRLFTRVTDKEQGTDIESLVKVARRELRQRFVDADMGISGANFAIAESGTLGLITNEGNGRLVTTLPRVHVALLGLDKLLPSLDDALTILHGLPRNATGQAITSYVTWITGAVECGVAAKGRKEMHVVFLDNGRRALAKDPVFSQALRCVRCGACANVCPIYRLVGGHKYGHIYIGAIGLILTYFFHGLKADANLVQNCLNCQACKDVCLAGIDLPRLIKEVQRLIQSQGKRPLINSSAALVLTHRRLFHALLRTGKLGQKPVRKGPYLRHLPHFLLGKEHDFKALPALAPKAFRDQWPKLKTKVASPRYRVGLFTGCLQDFVYPEQLVQAVELLTRHGVEVDFAFEQGCCGLPLFMLGEKEAAVQVARHNIHAVDPNEVDFILTLCASCGSHLKENYPLLLDQEPGVQVKARQFADKIIDFSSFVYTYLQPSRSMFRNKGPCTAYHAPCHLCRGMGVSKGPRELLQQAGLEYLPTPEEETCCGLGGTYSLKFPEVSGEIVNTKLLKLEQEGIEILATDCPGCIMQLRGAAAKRDNKIEVLHTAEALTRQMKPD